MLLRLCVQCGADISAHRRKTLCADCKRANGLEYKKEYRERIREQKGNRFCVICGKEYPRYGQKITCSPECDHKREKELRKRAHRNYYIKTERNTRGISDTCICIICGKNFPRNGQVKTCSPECKAVQQENWRLAAKTKRQAQKQKAV